MSKAVPFQFEEVLFFGRSIDEYRTMFNFSPAEHEGERILDCSSGPAALAAEGKKWGLRVVACDPLYDCSLAELRKVVDDGVQQVATLQAQTMDLFDDAVRLAETRRNDMNKFLEDFVRGKAEGRYVSGALPNLPFADDEFDFALCGNFLFLYSAPESGGMMRNSPFDLDFHIRSLRELARVTKGEIRIYPLNGPEVDKHEYLDPVCEALGKQGLECNLQLVAHRDIKTALHLLSIQRK